MVVNAGNFFLRQKMKLELSAFGAVAWQWQWQWAVRTFAAVWAVCVRNAPMVGFWCMFRWSRSVEFLGSIKS